MGAALSNYNALDGRPTTLTGQSGMLIYPHMIVVITGFAPEVAIVTE